LFSYYKFEFGLSGRWFTSQGGDEGDDFIEADDGRYLPWLLYSSSELFMKFW